MDGRIKSGHDGKGMTGRGRGGDERVRYSAASFDARSG